MALQPKIKQDLFSHFLCHQTARQIVFHPMLSETASVVKAELNPKAATSDLYAYLVPLLVLNNIPKCKKSQSNHFLTNLTYIHTGGIADP